MGAMQILNKLEKFPDGNFLVNLNLLSHTILCKINNIHEIPKSVNQRSLKKTAPSA